MRITKSNINQFIDRTRISLGSRKITKIDYVPEGITHLHLGNNDLTELPKLPDSLTHLYCYNNNITSLPKLPNSLERLNCQNKKLTKLPKLPDGLNISCQNNNLPYKVTINNVREHNKLIKRKEILKRICV